jgi:hypothetical protein
MLLYHYDYPNIPVSLLYSDDRLTIYTPVAYRHDLQIPPVHSVHSTPKGWIPHVHPQGWVYFCHPETRVVTNDDIRIPKVLDTVEKYIVTYPLCDLADGMELLVPHDPQLNEHMFSLVVNHNACMAGYNLKEVMSTEGMDADHGVFEYNSVYTSLTYHPQ